MKNIISFDLEDWYQAFDFIGFNDWQNYEDRLIKGTDIILDLLANTSVSATFFVLGFNAEKHPDLIKKIHSQGHEIACHGYSHRRIKSLTPEEFRENLKKSISILEDLTGEKIYGFRAPWWSITKDDLWVLDVLVEEGLMYDSSIFPFKTGFYGMKTKDPGIKDIQTPSENSIVEVFPSVYRLLGLKIPITGGFFFRNTPKFIISKGIEKLNEESKPAVFYFHPWEFDESQPRIKCPLKERIIHYTGLRNQRSKLRYFLEKYEFTTIKDYLESSEMID